MSIRVYINEIQIGGNNYYPLFLDKYIGKKEIDKELLIKDYFKYVEEKIKLFNTDKRIIEIINDDSYPNVEKLVRIREKIEFYEEVKQITRELLLKNKFAIEIH